MIDSVSNKELYDKFHEFYIAVIKHIICSITLTRDDGAAVDVKMLHRAQECCLAAFDDLNRAKYEDAPNNTPYAEQSGTSSINL